MAAQDFHDKYLLGVKIGRGAFAQVRACSKVSAGPLRPGHGDDVPKQERAVKILNLKCKEQPDEVSLQLQKVAHKEATVWKTVGIHPNCVRLHDLFFDSDFCYMVMEKCQSGLLQALESMPEITERGLGNVFSQMLLGISHCHSAKVVHRDIKPDNFLVGGNDGGVIKLVDFGLSGIIPKQGKLPGVFGSAPFICPEMLVARCYDEKADVWSFAVTVYVLLFGQFPYMPKQQGSKAMKQAIIDVFPPPSFKPVQNAAAGPNALMRSPDARSLVKTLLNRDPEQRPGAEEILHMTWMNSARQGCYMLGVELPSLRPMLHAAKTVGAFEVRDLARDTKADVVLNAMQMQRHGQPLPPTPSHTCRRTKEERSSSKGKAQRLSGYDWETVPSQSTKCSDSTSNGMNNGNWDQGFTLDLLS